MRNLAVSRGLTRPQDVVDLLLTAAWGEAAAAQVVTGAPGLGRLTALRSEAAREVAAALRATVPEQLRMDGTPDAPSMPALAALLAYGRHLGIVHDELSEVGRAIVEDAAGANTRSRGEVFLTQHAGLLERLAVTREQPGTAPWLHTGLAALAAFDHAGIGREPLDEEGAGDQLIRTAVTAAAVAATVVAGKGSGLGVLAPVTRVIKGATMVPYWVTRGLTTGGVVARSLGVLALASGGVLLALALLGLLDGTLAGIAATVGAGVFLAGLTYGAMRTGSRLRGRRWTGRSTTTVRAAGLAVVVLVVGALVVVLVAGGATRLDRLPPWVRGAGAAGPWLLGVAVVALAVLATAGVVLAARGLRRWQRDGDAWRLERSSGSAGVAAGWSVVYGVVALVGCAAVLRWWPEGPGVVLPAGWVVAVLAALAAVLLVPVPLVALWRARREVTRRVHAALERVGPKLGEGDLAARRAAWLEANGWAYSAVVRTVDGPGGGHLELRPRENRALDRSGPA